MVNKDKAVDTKKVTKPETGFDSNDSLFPLFNPFEKMLIKKLDGSTIPTKKFSTANVEVATGESRLLDLRRTDKMNTATIK